MILPAPNSDEPTAGEWEAHRCVALANYEEAHELTPAEAAEMFTSICDRVRKDMDELAHSIAMTSRELRNFIAVAILFEEDLDGAD